jgi:predicted DCC family thiol-disulfide oxidoreductase YuxK
MNNPDHIILFDGVCNLCNGFVKFVIKKDRHAVLRFAPLQSEYGITFLKKLNSYKKNYDTVIYISGDKYFFKSTAVLKILKDIGGIWKLFYGLVIIPPFLRDFIYDLIATNRFRIFGKRDSCMAPSKEIKERFL